MSVQTWSHVGFGGRRWNRARLVGPITTTPDRTRSRGRRRPGVAVRRRRLTLGTLAALALLFGLVAGMAADTATGGAAAVPARAGVGADQAGAGADVAPGESAASGSLSVVPMSTEVATVTVLPGDTLWSIATRTYPDADPREVVVAFRAANGDQLRTLDIGEQLVVPAGL